MPVACGSSQARDQTQTQTTTVMMPNPQPPPFLNGNSPIFKLGCLFPYCCTLEVLCVFGILVLYQIHVFANMFSQVIACLFILLTVSSADQMFLILIKSNLPIFFPLQTYYQGWDPVPKEKNKYGLAAYLFYHWSQRLFPWEIQLQGWWNKWETTDCILAADVHLKCTLSHEKGKYSGWSGCSSPKVERLGSHTKWQHEGRQKGECGNRVPGLECSSAMPGAETSATHSHQHVLCLPQPGGNLYLFFA